MRTKKHNTLAIILITITTFLVVEVSSAQSKQYSRKKEKTAAAKAPGKQTGKKKNEKLDISDLEQQYWAPKDTDFSVVQNRTYTKEKRFGLSLGFGPLINDPYSRALATNVALNYYLSERYGLELSYMFTPTEDSKMTKAFGSQQGFPDHNKVKDYYGVSFNWIPLYAKASVLGEKIIYFDMAVSPGLGVTEYEQQIRTGNKKKTAIAATLDVTQHFFLTRNFALRFDVKNRWYQQKQVTYGNIGNPSESKGTGLESATVVLFGATFYY